MTNSDSDQEAIPDDEILPEYSLEGAVRGKYSKYFQPDTKVVVLDPDVAEVFPNATAVNSALRALAGIIREAGHVPVG
jgi:hypothetical protein